MTHTRRNQWIFNTNSRSAYERKCQECQQPVLVGLNDDTCAWGVAVEPPPFLSTIGLILARLNQRPLYALSGKRREQRLHPAASQAREQDRVLPEHWCGEPLPEFWRQPPLATTSSRPRF